LTNLQIFKNDNFGEVRVKEKDNGNIHSLIIGDQEVDRYKMLAVASKLASEDKEKAWNIMKIASILFHPQDDWVFNELYSCTAMDITRVTSQNEFNLHSEFNKKINKLFDNAELLDKKNNAHHQPDSWIKIKDKEIPVEMKLDSFDTKALDQLLRYMNFYKTEMGIAVGSDLKVDLPKNIIFISKDEIENV